MISATSFGSTQWTRERTSGEPKRVLRGGRTLRGEFCAGERLKAAPQIGENLVRHPGAHAAGIDELAVIGVVAEQQRAEMRPRSFRVGPADDNELLAVQRFGFAPQAAVSRRIRRVDRLRDHAFKTELAGVLQDEFAVACFMAVELKAGLVCDKGSSSALRSMSGKPETSQPARCKRSKA